CPHGVSASKVICGRFSTSFLIRISYLTGPIVPTLRKAQVVLDGDGLRLAVAPWASAGKDADGLEPTAVTFGQSAHPAGDRLWPSARLDLQGGRQAGGVVRWSQVRDRIDEGDCGSAIAPFVT